MEPVVGEESAYGGIQPDGDLRHALEGVRDLKCCSE